MAKTFTSNTYEGRYLQLSISESVDTKNNRSTLTWTLKSAGGSSTWYSIAATKVVINGTTVYSKGATDWNDKVFPAAKGSVSGTINVAHNSDGSKSINIGFSTRVYYNGAEEYGGTMTLTKIDRTAPTVKVTVGTITANSIKITVTSSATADVWKYSINNGSSYVTFNSTTGTSKTYTITGLSSNTTYKIKAQARKDSNEVTGTSAVVSAKTLGASVIVSVSEVVADDSIVDISLKPTVYNSSYIHKLVIKKGSSALVTITDLSLLSNEINTIRLTATQRSALLNAMPNAQSFSSTFELTTYNGGTQVGSVSTKTVVIKTTADNSAPIFSGFTYEDSNATTVAVTTNDQVLIQNVSTLLVTARAATAKNGASIINYSVKIGSVEATSSTTSIDVGVVLNSGDVSLLVTAIDSRGYTASASAVVKVVPYKAIAIIGDDNRAHRRNEVDAIVKACVEGTLSVLSIPSVLDPLNDSSDAYILDNNGNQIISSILAVDNKNSLILARYRYKKTNATSYSSWINITSSFSSTSTTFSLGSLENEFELSPSFDEDFSYHIQFQVKDVLTEDTITFTVAQGIPLLAFRKKMVGVNNRDPQAALDVIGNMILSGSLTYQGVEQMPKKTLISGQNWSSGTLTVPDISKYTIVLIKLVSVSARVLCYVHGGYVRGHLGVFTTSGNLVSYSVNCTISGDVLTYSTAGQMTHSQSGSHGAFTQRGVQEIIGIM